MTTKPATNKGDNYTSDMHRATVEFTREQRGRKVTEKRSIIVKVAPTTEGPQKEMVSSLTLIIRHEQLYTLRYLYAYLKAVNFAPLIVLLIVPEIITYTCC